MGFWDRIKKDIKKSLDEGIHVVKEGTSTVLGRAESLAEEGKKRIRTFELKQKIQAQFTELGGQLYDLIEKNIKSPLTHQSIRSILKKIDSLKEQISRLEEKTKKPAKKKAVKKTTAKKKKVKKKAVKKSAPGETNG